MTFFKTGLPPVASSLVLPESKAKMVPESTLWHDRLERQPIRTKMGIQEKYSKEEILWHSMFDSMDIMALHDAANAPLGKRIERIDEVVEVLKAKYPKRFRKEALETQQPRTSV